MLRLVAASEARGTSAPTSETRPLVALNCLGTLISTDLRARDPGALSPLRELAEDRRIDLALTTKQGPELAARYLEIARAQIGLPVGDRIYALPDLMLPSEVDEHGSCCLHSPYKDFTALLTDREFPFSEARNRFLTVESFDPFALLPLLQRDTLTPEDIFILAQSGNPFPLPGGQLPLATLFIPNFDPGHTDELYIFRALAAAITEITESRGNVFPEEQEVNTIQPIRIGGSRWLYCPTTFRLAKHLPRVLRQAGGMSSLALRAWKQWPAPYRYLFYIS